MMLTISGFARGKCVWCRKEDEGVDAKFHDGLHGFFCKRHLWEALKARSGSADRKEVKDGATHRPA